MPETLLVWSGTAAYGIAAILTFIRSGGTVRYQAWAHSLLWLGVILLALAITLRWVENGQGPFMTLYEVLISSGFSLGLVYALAISLFAEVRRGMMIALPFLFMLTIWASGLSTDVVPLPPTFDNFWLWIHLFSGKLFLGSLLAAVSLAGALLLQNNRAGQSDAEVQKLDGLVWRLASVAFVFDSFMLLAGAVWAHIAWGRYWAWDPLETWAFITWLSLGMLLHARLTFRMPLWLGWAASVLVFVIAFLTFFGVPFLSHTAHKGVM